MDNQFSYFFRLSAVLEAMPDALVIIDEKGRIVLINKQTEKLFGYERTELLGELVERLMPERFRKRHVNHRTDFTKTPRTRAMGAGLDLFGLKKDGAEFPIEISLSPLKTDEGLLVLAAVRDITIQKLLQEQLHNKNDQLEATNRRVQEASRLKSEFLANMSHELRTPLNGIIGFTELMHSGKVGPISTEHKEYLSDILSSSRHLLQLINDILDLSKVESGKMGFNPKKSDLLKLINEVRDILRTLIANKQIKLSIEVDPDIQEITIDPAKFKQILYNYISNAIKFTGFDGQVNIRAYPVGKNDFRIEVQDSGIGIHKEDLNKLFVEFQQLDTSLAKKYQGTGLGLALTRRIVEAQGGEVGVESTFGKGSTFYAILPRSAHIERVEDKNNLVSSEKINPVKTILVIEDDPKEKEMIQKILTNAGYIVITASSGKEALRKIEQHQFDAITLDLLLPDMSAHEVLSGIRSNKQNGNIPIIIMSVIAEESKERDFGVQDYIEKPINQSVLLSTLQRIKLDNPKNKKVLVVDDDLLSLKLTETILKDNGYEPICKNDGKSGLLAIQEEKPSIMILDLYMPGMNGFEFLYRYNKLNLEKKIPIIIWTANNLNQKERTCLEEYSHSVVLKKDNSMQNLLKKVQEGLKDDH